MNSKRILITGGGTGGHLSPAIAIYQQCKRDGIDAYVLVGKKDLRFAYLREIDSQKLLNYAAPTLTKNLFKLPFACVAFLFAVMSA